MWETYFFLPLHLSRCSYYCGYAKLGVSKLGLLLVVLFSNNDDVIVIRATFNAGLMNDSVFLREKSNRFRKTMETRQHKHGLCWISALFGNQKGAVSPLVYFKGSHSLLEDRNMFLFSGNKLTDPVLF